MYTPRLWGISLAKSLKTNIKCCKFAVWITNKKLCRSDHSAWVIQIRSDFLCSCCTCTVAKSKIVHLCCWKRLHSRHAIYRLFKPGSGFSLSLVPSGPMRVSARTDRLNKQTWCLRPLPALVQVIVCTMYRDPEFIIFMIKLSPIGLVKTEIYSLQTLSLLCHVSQFLPEFSKTGL